MVNRKDFRPETASYRMSGKDKDTIKKANIRKHTVIDGYKYSHEYPDGEEIFTKNGKMYVYEGEKNFRFIGYHPDSLKKGTSQEHKEHPEFSKADARKIAQDHLRENPRYYDRLSDKEAEAIVKKNLRENPRYYDRLSDKEAEAIVKKNLKENPAYYNKNSKSNPTHIDNLDYQDYVEYSNAKTKYVKIKTGYGSYEYKKYSDVVKEDGSSGNTPIERNVLGYPVLYNESGTVAYGFNKSNYENPSARDIIQREYGKSKNMMTPTILSIGKTKSGAYELSQGRGIENENIYGVSIVKYDKATGKTERDYDRSKMFRSKIEATSYIERIKKE